MHLRSWLPGILGLFLIASGVSAADLATTAASWPQWRGPNRDGQSSEKGLNKDWEKKAPTLVWTGDGMGTGYASVSVHNDRIYTMGNFEDGQAVIAIRAQDGKIIWKKSITEKAPKHGYDGSRCTPSIDGENLYVVASDGQISCLKQSDGSVVWSKDFKKEWDGRMMSGWGFSESPLVDGPWVLCTPGGKEAMVVALDKLTGAEVWRSAVARFDDKITNKGKRSNDGAGYSSIVISHAAGVKQYVQLVGYGVIGIRATNGEFLWGYGGVANGTANIPTPLVSGDYVFASTGYQTGSALLKLSRDNEGVKANEVYFLEPKKLQNHHGGMILHDGHIYCGHAHNQGFPICVEMATGKIKWGGETRGPGSGFAAVTYADGHLIFRYQSGEVALIEANPNEYVLKGSFKPEYVKSPSWAHPVVAGGRLYLREQNKLMCYNLKD